MDSRTRLNIVANFAGRGWQALLTLAVVPFYLNILGAEAYGLIGFFVSLQALLALLDLGIGGTLSRELARSSPTAKDESNAQDTVRTLELIYWSIGLVAGLLLVGLSPVLAASWLKVEQLSPESLQRNLLYMVLAITIQWPSSLYTSGLIGLQRQVVSNMAGIFASTFRIVGSVLAIWLVAPSTEIFFAWQILAAIVQTGLMRWLLWRQLTLGKRRPVPRFSVAVLRQQWRFAASMSATSLVTVSLGQLDKLILSGILPLRVFGYYMLANTIAQSISLLPAPISDALFPRYAQLVYQNDEVELGRLFQAVTPIIACLIFPAAAVVAVFSMDILWLWTGDMEIAISACLATSVLVIGVALYYQLGTLDLLLMAYGWMRPAFYTRLVALLSIAPLMWHLSARYGAVGAAFAWLIVYCGAMLIMPSVVFNRILKKTKWRWYGGWGKIFLISSLVAISFKAIAFQHEPKSLMLMFVVAAWLAAVLACVLLVSSLRQIAKNIFSKRKVVES